METWKTPPEAPLYEVSDMGRVRRAVAGQRTRVGKIVKRKPQPNGYQQALLAIAPNKYKQFYVHRLVMSAFRGSSELHVNHINGVRNDNRLLNLEYCTPLENSKHSKEVLGTSLFGSRNGRAKLGESDVREILRLRSNDISCRAIAKQFGVWHSLIERICSGKAWAHISGPKRST